MTGKCIWQVTIELFELCIYSSSLAAMGTFIEHVARAPKRIKQARCVVCVPTICKRTLRNPVCGLPLSRSLADVILKINVTAVLKLFVCSDQKQNSLLKIYLEALTIRNFNTIFFLA